MTRLTEWLKNSRIAALAGTLLFAPIRWAGFLLAGRAKGIAVISLHKLGDTVFTVPAVKWLVNQEPGTPLSIICYAESIPIYQTAGIAADFISIGRNEIVFNGRVASVSARRKLRSVRASVIYDLSGASYSATLIAGVPARKIIGINDIIFRGIYTSFKTIRTVPHLADIYLDAVGAPDTAERKILKEFPAVPGGSYVVIAPFAGWRAKEWGMWRFIELAKSLREDLPVTMVVPAATITDEIRHQVRDAGMTLKETTDILELLDVLRSASVVIANDSGPIHIAAMLGKPTFTIFGPTHPAYHLPSGHLHGFIRADVCCVPFSEKYCHTHGGVFCPDVICLPSLKVDVVTAAVRTFLGAVRSSP